MITSIVSELADEDNSTQGKGARHLDARPLDARRQEAMQDAREKGCKTSERKNGLRMADTLGHNRPRVGQRGKARMHGAISKTPHPYCESPELGGLL